MSLIRGEPETVLRWAGPLILGGLLLGFASASLKTPGAITAVFAICLGAAGGSLVHWRQDRGLWMLAGLFLLLYGAVYALFLYGQARDLFRGVARPDAALAIDLSLGTLLLGSTNRFLWRAMKDNWKFSRGAGPEKESFSRPEVTDQ